jgi:7-cyano-7-deazaguanine synthase
VSSKAIILLSGGLDSATCLAIASEAGFQCHALSFRYGQRHEAELKSAAQVGRHFGVMEHRVATIDLGALGGSALTDHSLVVPTNGIEPGIPITYVPARNTVFLAYALAWAEVLGADDIFIGVNAVDYSGYPDCRPEFLSAFAAMANLATRRAVEGKQLTVHSPLVSLSKADIIRRGMALGVPFEATVSCYQSDPQGLACGVCDSCRIRKQGFELAGVSDPTRYLGAD